MAATAKTAEHRCLTISRKSAFDGFTAVCSCGWRSDEMATYTYAASAWFGHKRYAKGDHVRV